MDKVKAQKIIEDYKNELIDYDEVMNFFYFYIKNICNYNIKKWEIIKYDYQDLTQIISMQLEKIIEDYNKEEGLFLPYLNRSIKNITITNIKNHIKHSHQSIDEPININCEELYLKNILPDKNNYSSTLDKMIAEEDLVNALKSLTKKELKVITEKIQGLKTREIVIELNLSDKSVDNALVRAKNKLIKKNIRPSLKFGQKTKKYKKKKNTAKKRKHNNKPIRQWHNNLNKGLLSD